MSLSQITRDGSPSIAFLTEQSSEPAFGSVRVDPETAMSWARANKVKIDGPGSKMARINSARFAAGLPEFVLTQPRPQEAPVMAKPAAVGTEALRTARDGKLVAVVTQPPPSPSPPVAAESLAPIRKPGPRTIRDEAELIDLVSDFDGTVTVRCGKELAGWLWALNTANRPLQASRVDRFAKLLLNDEFVLTGEPMIVTKQGTLSDGQHRIKAILDTGIETTIDIRFGIEKSAFVATGTGARRTLGNVLAISGRPHASRVAAIARLLAHYNARTMARSNQQVEPHVVMAIVEREKHLPEIAAWTAQAKFAPARSAPIGMVLAAAARLHSLDKVLEFANLLESGLADDTSPARLLHIRLRDAAMARERLHQSDMAALGIRAFNAWAAGKALHHLKLMDADRASEKFPEVHGG